MSNHGSFEIEEEDTVRLASSREGGVARRGYVNVGTHCVLLQLGDDGELIVEVCARTNEDKPLGTVVVSKAQSVEAGGVDPDADDEDDLTDSLQADNSKPPQDDAAFDAYIANEYFTKIWRVGVMEQFLLRAAKRYHVLDKELRAAINAHQDYPEVKTKAWSFLAEQFTNESSDLRMFFSEMRDFEPQSPQVRKRVFAVADALLCSAKDVTKIADAEHISRLGKVDLLLANASGQVGANHTFCKLAKEMLNDVQGEMAAVDWSAFNKEVVQRCIVQNNQPPADVEALLLECSPGAVTSDQREEISLAIRNGVKQRNARGHAPDARGLER